MALLMAAAGCGVGGVGRVAEEIVLRRLGSGAGVVEEDRVWLGEKLDLVGGVGCGDRPEAEVEGAW